MENGRGGGLAICTRLIIQLISELRWEFIKEKVKAKGKKRSFR